MDDHDIESAEGNPLTDESKDASRALLGANAGTGQKHPSETAHMMAANQNKMVYEMNPHQRGGSQKVDMYDKDLKQLQKIKDNLNGINAENADMEFAEKGGTDDG